MITKTWLGGSDSNYFNGLNWSPNGAPASDGSEDVLVTGTTAYSIQVTANTAGPTYAAGNLFLDDPNMTLSIGSFNFNVQSSTTFTAGTVTIAGGEFFLGASGPNTFGSAAFLSGYGVLFNDISGTGTIEASGGAAGSILEVGGVISSGSLQLNIGANDYLQFDLGVAAGNTVTFEGSTGGIILADTAAFQATVSGFVEAASTADTPTSVIDIGDYDNVSGFFDATNHRIVLTAGTNNAGGADITSPLYISVSGSYDPATVLMTRADTVVGSGTDIWLAVCFAEGTRILTTRGEVAVEALAEDDVVVTADQGAQPVRWIGHRHIDLSAHPRPETAAPVRIRRGAFAENQPQRDLVVSPDHCLFVDGKLVPAKLLINGMTIVQERDAKAVTYYHVELDRHAVLFAEGLPAESYLDTGNRAFFSNAGLALVLHPEFHVNAGLNCWEQDACAPLAVSDSAVRPVWQALAARAEALGFAQPEIVTTDDADLRLVAAGRTFRPISAHANRFVFMLPAGVTGAHLVSRAGSPADVQPWLEDHRQLGVAVSRIVLRSEADYTDIAIDHPALRQGWHAVETAGRAMWRWTNGNAALPIVAGSSPVTVEVHVRQTGTYVVAAAQPAARLAA